MMAGTQERILINWHKLKMRKDEMQNIPQNDSFWRKQWGWIEYL